MAAGPRSCSTANPCARRARRRSVADSRACRGHRRGMARARRAHRSLDHAAHPARQQRDRRRRGTRAGGRRRHRPACGLGPSLLSGRRRRRRLVEAQRVHWDPVLAFARNELKAPLVLSEGVVHVAPARSLARAHQAGDRRPRSFPLAALHVMTALTGSALLALAVLRGKVSRRNRRGKPPMSMRTFQISQWGEDAGGKAERRAHRWRDFPPRPGSATWSG